MATEIEDTLWEVQVQIAYNAVEFLAIPAKTIVEAIKKASVDDHRILSARQMQAKLKL